MAKHRADQMRQEWSEYRRLILVFKSSVSDRFIRYARGYAPTTVR